MDKVNIKLLCTTDVHGYLDKGVSQLPCLRNNLKADILIDNGDFLVGSSFATFGYLSENITPLVEVANELTYDVMIPGNHDLDYGLNWLKQQVSCLNAHYVCANLYDRENQLIFEPYALLERRSIKIAVIGLMTYGLGQLLPEAVVGQVKTKSPLIVLEEMLPDVSKLADVIIVAYHGGLTRDPVAGKVWHYASLEDQAYELLASFPAIDSIICGHQHFTNAEVNTKLGTGLIQPGAFGELVGYQVFEVTKGTETVSLLENRLITFENKELYRTRFESSYQAWLNSTFDTQKLKHYIQETFKSDIYVLGFEAQTICELSLELNVPFPLNEYCMTGLEFKEI